jgi:hypothetical protein
MVSIVLIGLVITKNTEFTFWHVIFGNSKFFLSSPAVQSRLTRLMQKTLRGFSGPAAQISASQYSRIFYLTPGDFIIRDFIPTY